MGRVYSLPGNCLTWGHLGSASPMVVLMETSKRVATKRDLSTAAASAPVPVVSPCGSTTPHLPQETLQHEQVVWIVSCGVTAPFLWGLVCANFCLCPPRLESLFPQVPWKSYNQIPLAFKIRFPGDSQSLCHMAWHGVQNLHNRRGTSLVSLFSRFWVTHTVGMGFYFIVIHPSYCLAVASSLSLNVRYFFGGFQCSPVNGCSTASCNFGALAGGDECTSFYSAILNQKQWEWSLLRKYWQQD